MSSKEQRLAARIGIALADDLRRIGIPPLRKSFVSYAMRNTAIGLSPDAWKWFASWRERHRQPEEWHVFTYDMYKIKHDESKTDDTNPPQFGVPIPDAVLQRIETVQTRLPGTRIEVYALRSDDPWVCVIRSDEREWIAGWFGRGSCQRVFVGHD
ncbi:MAG TPA: hypothetical protein VNM40_02725 [Candidatus Paceibacterota bacterium]|nr:hypothetical protein [Candidatus Paceibacterota bacterium]